MEVNIERTPNKFRLIVNLLVHDEITIEDQMIFHKYDGHKIFIGHIHFTDSQGTNVEISNAVYAKLKTIYEQLQAIWNEGPWETTFLGKQYGKKNTTDQARNTKHASS